MHIAPARATAQRTLRIGPRRSIKTLAEAAKIARDGDRIEVDAGDYRGDVAVWRQDDIEIAAVGGRVRLSADGAAAEGKGIWVVRGGRIEVEGFAFSGAAVPDRNGAGIRFDAGRLSVRDCTFTHNEMGLLTSNDPTAVLEVENCEFAHNFHPDEPNHNLYVGRIARLAVTGSYFHHARIGHLLKSRAGVSEIRYNRLTDESDGRASYELEFPNGGIAHVIGNIVAQSALTENPVLISFGAEGYSWPVNELYLANNTLIDRPDRAGTFLNVRPGAHRVRTLNNLLVGPTAVEPAADAQFFPERDNVWIERSAFERQSDQDFRLRPGSPLIGRLPVSYATDRSAAIEPLREYVHPRHSVALGSSAHNPGALQTPASTPP